MLTENHHAAHVDAWMKTIAGGLATELPVQLFEQALAALWRRAHLTLGEVTLMAIADRVLSTATEKYPRLSSLQVEAAGIRWDEFYACAGARDGRELANGLRFVLVELLTILGNLTAEILTPALHAELSKVGLQDAPASSRDRKARRRARRPKETRG